MAPSAKALVVVATLACVTATTSAAQETSPFPHGWVVFTADTDRGKQCCDLFKVRTDGSGLRRLARGTDDSPTFAPNGKRVAFSASTTRGGKGIFEVNLDGSGRARLTTGDGSEPEYSPDGKRIAFLRGVDLYVMRADGGGQRRLRRGWPEVGPPSWTPDGTSIVLSASQGESYSSLFLYTLAARTGRIERQTLLQKNNGAPGPGGGGGALLSPDGRTVVFTGIKPTCGECDPAYALFRKELPGAQSDKCAMAVVRTAGRQTAASSPGVGDVRSTSACFETAA